MTQMGNTISLYSPFRLGTLFANVKRVIFIIHSNGKKTPYFNCEIGGIMPSFQAFPPFSSKSLGSNKHKGIQFSLLHILTCLKFTFFRLLKKSNEI